MTAEEWKTLKRHKPKQSKRATLRILTASTRLYLKSEKDAKRRKREQESKSEKKCFLRKYPLSAKKCFLRKMRENYKK